jgi:Flp pilus assembly protein CpaB
MRASTLFALTVAVLIGLGVAVAAKLGGYFSPPPAVEPPPKKAEIMILAAAHNLFAGDLIDPSGVHVRALKPEELAHYQKNRDQYLPPLPNAAALRITRRNILADEPIVKECLQEMTRPEALHSRLLPQMRAVNLSLTKEHSAGGLIQVGDWVDVFLTSKIDNQGASTTRTACIIPKVRVIAKRNSLWPIFAPLPDDKPVNFTLEVNPYRAGLLEFSRAKGLLSMAPLPADEKHKLETRRGEMLENPEGIRPVHFIETGTAEANAEDERVAAFGRGELVVSEFDLIRIFGLTTPPPPTAPISVERFSGIYRYEPATFTAEGIPISKNARTATGAETRRGVGRPGIAAPAFQFSDPTDCPTCKKNADKATR